MTEPLKEGASKGQLNSSSDLKLLFDEYYEARGWGVNTDVPTKEKLQELGLGYVAEDIKS